MIEIFDCEQRSSQWFAVRMGIPTSSEFSTVMAKGRGGGESKGRHTYLCKLAGEIITGEPMDSFTNQHMERGREMEGKARAFYALMKDVDPQTVGFIRNGRTGTSPDALLGDDGMLEIKTALAHIQVDRILKDAFPPEYRAQCQGQLWVAEREWLDLVVYCPKMPLFVKRVARDDSYISDLSDAIDAFNRELDEMVDQVHAHETSAKAFESKPVAPPVDLETAKPIF